LIRWEVRSAKRKSYWNMRAISFFDKHSLPKKVSLSAIYKNQGVRGVFYKQLDKSHPSRGWRITNYHTKHMWTTCIPFFIPHRRCLRGPKFPLLSLQRLCLLFGNKCTPKQCQRTDKSHINRLQIARFSHMRKAIDRVCLYRYENPQNPSECTWMHM